MTRVFAFGPRESKIGDSKSWVQIELARCMHRLRQRHGDALAMVSLTPGVGSWWFDHAQKFNVPIDSWAVHVDMGLHWANGTRVRFNNMIKDSESFRVAYPREDKLEPWMHLGHFREMAQEANVTVAVWDGDRDNFVADILDHTNRQFYWIDFKQRQVKWCPDGYEG